MVTALFDGYCVICQSTRKTIKTFDWFNRVEFLDLHNATEAQSRYPELDYDELMGEIHVVDPDGALYAGYYGTRRMLKEVPLGLPIWLLLQIPGMDWIGTRIYKFIARNRYQINKMLGNEIPDCVDGVCKIPQ